MDTKPKIRVGEIVSVDGVDHVVTQVYERGLEVIPLQNYLTVVNSVPDFIPKAESNIGLGCAMFFVVAAAVGVACFFHFFGQFIIQ